MSEGDWYYFALCKTPTCQRPLAIAPDPSRGKTAFEAPFMFGHTCPECGQRHPYFQEDIKAGPIPTHS
jgi:hypothetical protein